MNTVSTPAPSAPAVPPAVVASTPLPSVAAPAAVKQRAAPATIAAIRSDIAIPEKAKRGTKSSYDFDKLPVGGSVGVMDKTADKMASTISAANRRYRTEQRDANGAIIYKAVEMKDAAGVVVGMVPGTEPAGYVQTREFAVFPTDPEKDPDGATCRIFRLK